MGLADLVCNHNPAVPGCVACEIRESFDKADEERHQRHLADVNNGKHGYWRVDGVRHSAVVRASSAVEAVEKSGIGNWESPEAAFIGEQMPDVFEC